MANSSFLIGVDDSLVKMEAEKGTYPERVEGSF